MESTPTKERSEKINYQYEVLPYSPQVEKEIVAFLLDQKNRYKDDTGEAEEHAFSLVYNANHVLSEISKHGDMKKSFAILVKNDSQTIGFTVVGIDTSNTVFAAFVGVAYENLRQGIATELLRQRHEVLRNQGIKEYRVSAWEGSRKAMEHALGRPLEVDPNDPDQKIMNIVL